MKNFWILIFLWISPPLFADETDFTITLFGQEGNAASESLMWELDNAQLTYNYFDINAKPSYLTLLWDYVYEADWYEGGSIYLPVVIIDDVSYYRPSIEEIKTAISYDSAWFDTTYYGPEEYQVILYGRPTCSRCSSMRTKLESNGIAYTDLNIDEDGEALSDMWRWVYSSDDYDSGGSVGLPVMVVNSNACLINPSFDEVEAEIESN